MFIHTYDEYWNEGWAVAAFKTLPIDKITEIKEWCNKEYGVPGERWKDGIAFGEICFEDKKDLTLFVLRWS